MNRVKMLAMSMFGMALSEPKETARERREIKRKTHNVPPRSMTAEEKAYYDRNKSLAGFYK